MNIRATFRFAVLTLTTSASLLLPGCIIVTNGSNDSARYTETRTVRVPVNAGTPVDVRSRNGSVDLSAANGSEAVVTAVISARSQERLDATRIVADNAAGRLDIRVEWPDNRAQSGEGCSFRIDTPSPNNIHVETSNGRVSVRDASGHAEVDTSNASIRVVNFSGDVNATTSNGRIELRDITGAADANTSNGSIDLINIGGRAVATTSNASATVHLTENSPGPIQVRTSNGSIDLALGRSFTGDLRLSTSNGRLRFDSPVEVRDFESGRSATLRFGTGGGASSAVTSNGSVTVTSHAAAQQPVGAP